MKRTKTIQTKTKAIRFATALLMSGCLFFLTGINFFVYGTGKQPGMIEQSDAGLPEDEAPGKPAEEKSSAGNQGNMQEEYVHEFHPLKTGTSASNPLKYCLLDEARLAIVHFELISPPPDL
ncbi:MAG TPA: hypothetical protein PKJ94_01315 [Ferruginibacter sp.]|nr:hypothetical protein [Ferruginibacter sp.]